MCRTKMERRTDSRAARRPAGQPDSSMPPYNFVVLGVKHVFTKAIPEVNIRITIEECVHI